MLVTHTHTSAPESSKQGGGQKECQAAHDEDRIRDAEDVEFEAPRVDGMGNGDEAPPPQLTKGFCGIERRKLPPAGSGTEPRRKTILLLSKRQNASRCNVC